VNNIFEERLLETASNSGLVYLDAETMVPLINQVRKARKPWAEVKATLSDVYRKLDIEGIGSDRLRTQVNEEITAIDARIRRTLRILGRLEKHLSSRS